MNLSRIVITLLVGLAGILPAGAFTFLGQYKPWMTQDIGYNGVAGASDNGGPVLPSEGYRWNVPVIYYAFDRAFVEYFGSNGIAEVESVIKMINDLPAASQMSPTLSEYPLNTRQVNYKASNLGLLDLKSYALGMILEQVGLGSPESMVWALRNRSVINQSTNYSIVKLNYDPVTLRPSSYVNGALYTYEIFDGAINNIATSYAFEIKIADFRTRGYSSIASIIGGYIEEDGSVDGSSSEQDPLTGQIIPASGDLGFGEHVLGLTRDDVGGLRRLYGLHNVAVEGLPADVSVAGTSTASGAWSIPFNVIVTNIVLLTNSPIALRPGIDKLQFQRVTYDSLIGSVFNPFQTTYDDKFIQGNTLRTRRAVRTVVRPDIVFKAGDLGVSANGVPSIGARTSTASWTSNAGINRDPTFDLGGVIQDSGPGTINSPISIYFSDVFPYYRGFAPSAVTEAEALQGVAWGSFNGASDTPVVYPTFSGTGVELLQRLASGLEQNQFSPWDIVVTSFFNTNTTGQVTSGATGGTGNP